MRWLALLWVLGSVAWAQMVAPGFQERFDQAWRLVAEQYWDRAYGGVDWEAVRQKYQQELPSLQDWDGLYGLLRRMYAEIGDQHTTFLSPTQATEYFSTGGCIDLPIPRQAQQIEATSTLPPGVSFRDGVAILQLSSLLSAELVRNLLLAVQQVEQGQAPMPIKGYILDLRGNPGGLLVRMAEVAAIFMRGLPWRVITGRYGTYPQFTLPPYGTAPTQKPLVVLIDARVNSAAEGLAGALKESRRAYLIGQTTAGNTEVLVPYCFPDRAVGLVAAGVLAPIRGPTWEGRGVTPDLEVNPELALEVAVEYLNNLPATRN
jgi:carboxyl-terminal processing protease